MVTKLSRLFTLKMYRTAERPLCSCSQYDEFIFTEQHSDMLSALWTAGWVFAASANGTFDFNSKRQAPLLKSSFYSVLIPTCNSTCVLLYMSIKLFLHFTSLHFFPPLSQPFLITESDPDMSKFCCIIIYLNKMTLVHIWGGEKMYFFNQPSIRFCNAAADASQ